MYNLRKVKLRTVILLTVLLSWNVPAALSVQVCDCPDFRLSLSAESEVDQVESLHGGFVYVAAEGSDVNLKCELDDKDHPAVHAVEYSFHKTYELSSARPIFLGWKNREVCPDSSTSTCTLESVHYQYPDMDVNLDDQDNLFYQCSVRITLKDGGEVVLWSHTIKLDVYVQPIPSTDGWDKEIHTKSEGRSMIKFQCALPRSNPKTKALWSYREYGSADWQIIDIPNDARGERLAIVEDEKEAGVGEERGTLMLMIFNPVEDVGDYKCEGVYESVLDVPEEVSKFLIANHELRETGHIDSGALQLRPISAITYPKLVDQDSAVNFTVYARDTPGRGKYGDVTYTWQMDYEDIDFDASPHLRLSNFGRTLTVDNLPEYATRSFNCQMQRSVTDSDPHYATSATMGFRDDDVVIAPKFLSIPLTFKSCVEPGEQLKATPNRAYMMSSAELAGENPEQILLGAQSFRYYINDYPFSFISDRAENYDNVTHVGITEAMFNARLPDRENDRCVYYQYMRGGYNYQVVEVMKLHRTMEENGCAKVDMEQFASAAEITKDESQSRVSATFPSTTDLTTPLTVRIDLLDSSNAVLQSKNIGPETAESSLESAAGEKTPPSPLPVPNNDVNEIWENQCSSWEFPLTVDFTDIPRDRMTKLSVKFYLKTFPDDAFVKPVPEKEEEDEEEEDGEFSLVDSYGNPVIPLLGVQGLLLWKDGTVCDDGFSDDTADTICRELGYNSHFSWASEWRWDIQKVFYDIHMDDIDCAGEDWSSCTYKENHNCEHEEDVFLGCM